MLTPTQADAKVAAGAAFLDHKYPGWENRIDLGTLTLWESCSCIIGQLVPVKSGHWIHRLLAAGLSDIDTAAFGFNAPLLNSVDDVEWSALKTKYSVDLALVQWYQPLQDAWVALIVERRARAEVLGAAPEQPDAEMVTA